MGLASIDPVPEATPNRREPLDPLVFPDGETGPSTRGEPEGDPPSSPSSDDGSIANLPVVPPVNRQINLDDLVRALEAGRSTSNPKF